MDTTNQDRKKHSSDENHSDEDYYSYDDNYGESNQMCCPCMNICPYMMQKMYINSYQMKQPMMDMYEMNQNNQMNPMHIQDDNTNRQFPIPMLAKLQQLSPNQIQISYDRDVDVMLGTKPTNYWIQDMMNVRPRGIATLGKNNKVNAGNSLTSNMVRIQSRNGSARTFILTFNQVIPRGAQYKLIICYVTVKGAPPYSGDNGMATFTGK